MYVCQLLIRRTKLDGYQDHPRNFGHIALEVELDVAYRSVQHLSCKIEYQTVLVPGLTEIEIMPFSAYRFATCRATTTFPYKILESVKNIRSTVGALTNLL